MKTTKIFLFTLLAIFSLSFIANTTNVAQATSPVEGKLTITVTDATPPPAPTATLTADSYLLSSGENPSLNVRCTNLGTGSDAYSNITWPGGTGNAGGLTRDNVSTAAITKTTTYSLECGNSTQKVTADPITIKVKHTITFNNNGGSGSISDQIIIEGDSSNLKTNTFTKTSNTFDGWNTKTDGTGTSYVNGASYTMGDANVTLYAKWTTTTTGAVPTLTTTSVSSITSTTASSGGNTITDGGSAITAKGVVWGTSSGPTTALATKTSNGTGTANFSSSITGLTAGTKYYVRAYATNSVGTGYGNEVSFTTSAAIPPTPTSPSATISSTSCGTTSGTISWTASTGATTYVIYRSTNNSSYTALTPNVSAPTVSKTDSGLTAGQKYYYKIAAANGSGESAGTSAVSFTVPTACAGPTAASWSGYGACSGGSKSGYCTEQTGGHATTCSSLGYSAGTNTTTTGCTQPKPNLTTSASSPATATIDVAQNYTATITNSGSAAMGKTSRYFFQVASSANGGGTISNKTSSTLANLPAGGTATATLSNNTFTSVGTYSMRACADFTSPGVGDVITESNEGDNCGSWTNITVDVATCSDGIKNQNETSVDTGGVCDVGPGIDPIVADCKVVSDTTNIVSSGDNAVAAWAEHPMWTASIPGATWIWRTYFVENPASDETVTFTKTFYLTSTSNITDAQLITAADNTYTASINGTQIINQPGERNTLKANMQERYIKSYLNLGVNTLSFVVKNLAQTGGTATSKSNPAGLLYRLSITDSSGVNNNCDTFTPPDPSLPLADITSFNIMSNGTSALSPKTIRYNTRVNIDWTSANATSCACTSADTKGIPGLTCGDTVNDSPGSFQTLSLKKSMVFTLSCLNGDGVSTSKSKTVTVDDINTIYKEN